MSKAKGKYIALAVVVVVLLLVLVFAASSKAKNRVDAPSTYYIQNDGAHYIDGDPLALSNDLGTGTFYLEKTNADLVVLPDGVTTGGILSQIDSETESFSEGTDIVYTSADISGTGIILGTAEADLSITAKESAEVTLTIESLFVSDGNETVDKILEAKATAPSGTNTVKFELTRAYDDMQGEQPSYAAYRLPGLAKGQTGYSVLRVHVTADKSISVNQGASSTVTIPFLYESQTGYNGTATMGKKTFNATLYWLQENIYLYNHDTKTWVAKAPADSEYHVDNETHEAVFADFSFYALKTIKNGAVQEGYTAEGTSLYPFPSYRKLHVDTVQVNAVKDKLYLPTVQPLYQDVFLPYDGVDSEDEGNLPVLIYVHGAGGTYSDPKHPLAYESLANGYAVVGIDLRFYPPAFSPSYYLDINGNIRYIRANADKYGLDGDRIGIYGVSLGGNSSLMGAVANDNEYTEGDVGGNTDVSSRVQAVVAGFAWSDALNFGTDQRTDNAYDPDLLAGMVSGGDGESAPCAQAIDFSGPGKGYLVLRNYLEARTAAEESGTLEEFLAEPYTFTIDDEYIEKWFPTLGENAFTANSATVTKGTYTWDHEYLMEKIEYAKAASPLYHITPDDPAIMVFGGYGGKQNITNTQSTRTLQKAAEMGVPAVMAGNNLGNYGNEEEIVAAMVEFLDVNVKNSPVDTRISMTLGSKNIVVNSHDVASDNALIDEDGLKVKSALLNEYFGTSYTDEYVPTDELSIDGVTINTYTYEVYVGNSDKEERTTVVFLKDTPIATAAAAETKEAEITKTSLPADYYGYYDDEGGTEKTYKYTVEKSYYVEVPAHYDDVEYPSDPTPENDPSYNSENGTIKLAVNVILPSEDGETVAEGEFPTLVEASRDRLHKAGSMYNVDYFVQHGYSFVIINMRGCGSSFGINNSFASLENRNDIKYIMENHIAEQSWSTGRIGMLGGSNRGLIQWATAATEPEGLEAIAPEVCNPDFYYQDYRNGVSICPVGQKKSGTTLDAEVKTYEEWIETNPGSDGSTTKFVDEDPDGKLAYQAYCYQTLNNKPFTQYLLTPNLNRDEPNEYLYGEQVNLTIPAVEYANEIFDLNPKIQQIGGWSDANATYQIAATNTWGGKAVIGPWNHGKRGTSMEGYPGTTNEAGEEIIGRNVDKLRFFDYALKDMDNGYEDQPNFYYYVENGDSGEWRYGDTFPAENTDYSVLYLAPNSSGEQLSEAVTIDGGNNGKLSLVKPEEQTNEDYKVDLSISVPGANNLGYSRTEDYSVEVDAKGLTFTSAPLANATEIVGVPSAEIWISCDNANDADFICYLEEVKADGTSTYITSGMLRASHRTTGENVMWDSTPGLAGNYHTSLTADVEAALEEGLETPVKLQFNMEGVGYTVQSGSCIRFTVTCANTSMSQHEPYYKVDEATGEYVVDKNGNYVMMDDADLPEIKLYQGGDKASCITLPITDNVSNVFNGTITMADGSYTGPATMYLFEENWYVYYNGMWKKLAVGTENAYTVENGEAIFEAGFSFLPEMKRVIKNGAAQNYTGGGTYSLPFPDEFNLHLDTVANQTGNPNANSLLYLPANKELNINLFMPDDTTEPVPVIIYIHGFGGTCIDVNTNLLEMLDKGYAVAGVDLRNYPPNENPLYYQDIKGNIRYLRANAEELGIDPDRIGIYGTSLGGNTSLMMLLSGGDEFVEGDVGGNTDVSSRVQAGICGYAWSDAINFGLDQRNDHAYNPTLVGKMISGGDGESAPCAQAIDFSGPGKGYLVLRNYLAARQEAEDNGTLDEFLATDYTFTIDDEYIAKWFPVLGENKFTASSSAVTPGVYTYTHEYLMQKVADAQAASPIYYASPDDPAIVVFGGFGGAQNITNNQSVRTQYALQTVGVQCFYFGNSVVSWEDYGTYGNPASIQEGFQTYWDNYLMNSPSGTKIVLTLDSDTAVVNNVDRTVEESITIEGGEVKVPASVINEFLGTTLTGSLSIDEVAEAVGGTATWYDEYQMLVIKTDMEKS